MNDTLFISSQSSDGGDVGGKSVGEGQRRHFKMPSAHQQFSLLENERVRP